MSVVSHVLQKMKTNLKVWLTGAADKMTTTALEYLSWGNHRLIADLESDSSLNLVQKCCCEENQNTARNICLSLIIGIRSNLVFVLASPGILAVLGLEQKQEEGKRH